MPQNEFLHFNLPDNVRKDMWTLKEENNVTWCNDY